MNTQQAVIVKFLLVFFTLCLCSIPSYAVTWFDDGGVHDVNYVVTDQIQVWDNEALSVPTRVNFSTGFSTSYPVEVHLNSSINVNDGQFTSTSYLTAFDNSTTTFKGGIFEGSSGIYGYISALDNSTINIEDGIFEGRISARDYSNLFISADDFNGSEVELHNNAYSEITGGTIAAVHVRNDSQVYLTSGEIGMFWGHDNGKMIVDGGSLDVMYVSSSSVIIIHGTHFTINGEFVGAGEISYPEFRNGSLSCKLFNGDFLNTAFDLLNSNGRIILTSEIPEPPVYCLNPPSMDTNNDCKIDMTDFAAFVSQWMSCGLSAQEACW